jgi:hypothetical protein
MNIEHTTLSGEYREAKSWKNSEILEKEMYTKLTHEENMLNKSAKVNMEHLKTALKNAVKPSYAEEQCEWVLWCGAEEHAKAILDAAKAYLKEHE